jgi:hypothetical protein
MSLSRGDLSSKAHEQDEAIVIYEGDLGNIDLGIIDLGTIYDAVALGEGRSWS